MAGGGDPGPTQTIATPVVAGALAGDMEGAGGVTAIGAPGPTAPPAAARPDTVVPVAAAGTAEPVASKKDSSYVPVSRL